MSKKYMDIIPPKTAISGKSVGDAIDANAEVAKVAKDSRVTVDSFAKNSPAEISENVDRDSAEIKNAVPEDTQTAAEFAEISQENDVDFAIRLVKEHKIASIPLSVFYADKKDYKQLRFCFAKHDETIDKAIEILCKI